MTKIRINVTKEILQRSSMCGISADGEKILGSKLDNSVGGNCAIALAVREIFPKAFVGYEDIDPFFFETATEVETTSKGICYLANGNEEKKFKINLPKEASLFIGVFDDASPKERIELTPLSFEINVSENVINKLAEGWEEVLQESELLELV